MHEARGTAVLLALVAAGLGVALVPGSVRSFPLEGVVFREVTDAGAIPLALAWRRGETSAVVASVIEALVDADLFTPDTTEVAR